MRARQRHFNPKNLGAVLAFDARFMPYNNNDLVDSWTDRAAGAAYTASGTSRPTYKSAVSGGSPMVLSATSKRLSGDSTNYLTTSNAGFCTFLFLGSSNNSGGQAIMSIKSNSGVEFLMYLLNSASYWAFRTGGINGRSWTRPSANTNAIEAFTDGRPYINGVAVSFGNQTHGGVGNTNAVCNAGSQDSALIGYIGQLVVANVRFTVPQLKRLTFSGAFSFKIACS